MPNPRVELPGSYRDPLPGHETVGPADPSEQAHVTIVLRRKEPVLPITPYGAPKRVHEYIETHGASAGDFQAVRRFAAEYGLQGGNENAAARTIELHGRVGDLCRAFGTALETARIDDTIFRHRTGYIIVPEDLIPAVEAVLGLDNRPAAIPHFVKFKVGHSCPPTAGYSPLEVAELYEFPAHLDGTGQTIAIIELDGGFIPSDVVAYFRKLGLKPPKIETVLIDGQTDTIGKHLPLHPELNADDEVAMDIEVAGAIAPGAQQVVYFAQNTDQSFLKAVNAAIFATPQPACISISWGQAENAYSKQAMRAFEAAFQDAANLGIPVCVSAGNTEWFDETSTRHVDFPTSAPHALACGGTRLVALDGEITRETVWNAEVTDDQGKKVRQRTGGGVSQFFAKPVYQSSVAVPAPPEGSPGGRGVPDVSGNADPATGYRIRVKGAEEIVGGTSAVAPLWAGLIARMGQSIGGPVGFLNPQVYKTRTQAEGFRDITESNNGSPREDRLYHSTPGWNPLTGLGAPKGMALLRALGAPMPPQPKPEPRIAAHSTRPRITERDHRPESPAQPAMSSPALVEKTVAARIRVAEARTQRRGFTNPTSAACRASASIEASAAALKPVALIAPSRPVPVPDRPEIGDARASTDSRADSPLAQAPSRMERVSPARQHLPGIVGHADPVTLAGILGLTALTGMAASVATLTCIALGNGKAPHDTGSRKVIALNGVQQLIPKEVN
jgi:kumamolisin